VITRFTHASIAVHDLDLAIESWCSRFGLEPLHRLDTEIDRPPIPRVEVSRPTRLDRDHVGTEVCEHRRGNGPVKPAQVEHADAAEWSLRRPIVCRCRPSCPPDVPSGCTEVERRRASAPDRSADISQQRERRQHLAVVSGDVTHEDFVETEFVQRGEPVDHLGHAPMTSESGSIPR
jgi:catechol 2,3-dioxygenase-like lactoylglutathione lyase family enzyme